MMPDTIDTAKQGHSSVEASTQVGDPKRDVIDTAKSGRSNCRGCGRSIARGELRFGESLLNPYAEGETLFWFHLMCAACMRPEKFGPALEACSQPVPDADWLSQAVSVGLAHHRAPRLLRAERARSGTAHCRACRELISKDSWRLVLQIFEEGRMQPIGTIHAECAEAYFGTTEILDRIEKLTVGLEPDDLAEIERRINLRCAAVPANDQTSQQIAPSAPAADRSSMTKAKPPKKAEPRAPRRTQKPAAG